LSSLKNLYTGHVLRLNKYQNGGAVKRKRTLKDMIDPYLPKKDEIVPYLEFLTGASAETKDYKPDALDAMLALPILGGGAKLGSKLIKKLFSPKSVKAGEQILREGSSKAIRATKLPEKFAQVGKRRVGVAQFTDDVGNIIRQPMYQSTGTSGHGGFRAGQWMPFVGKRGSHYHKGRYALGKGGEPVSHMVQQDKYGNVLGLSPRMKKYLPNADKFDWEARMTGPTGPDTGRMKQLSYDFKQLENKLGDLPTEEVDWNDLNKWLKREGVNVPGDNWIPKGYQQGGSVKPDATKVHNNIDNLMLQEKLDKFDQTGVMYSQPEDPRGVADALSKDFVEGLLPIGAGVKLFRGVPKWFRGKMVKEGSHISPKKIDWGYGDEFVLENPSKKGLWATKDRGHAKEFAKTPDKSGYILEYDVPKKFYDDAVTSWNDPKSPFFAIPDWFDLGIPKEYLKKVHKGYQHGGTVEPLSIRDYFKRV